MNKFEVKEYLQKIYDIPVKRVMTQNYMGKRKRILGARGVWAYKRPDFKRAIVTIDYGHDSSTTAGRSSAA
jgi:large subunit ribosomal protein L23